MYKITVNGYQVYQTTVKSECKARFNKIVKTTTKEVVMRNDGEVVCDRKAQTAQTK